MDKVISAIVTIVLVLCGVQILLHYILAFVTWLIAGVCRALPGFLGGTVAVVAVWSLVLGVVSRARQRIRDNGPAAARSREVAAQRARVSVRRPAEDVPVHDGLGPEQDEDSDPELNPQDPNDE